MTTVTAVILRGMSSSLESTPTRLPGYKKMLHAVRQMTDIAQKLALSSRDMCAKKRFKAPPEETGSYHNSGREDTPLWESTVPSKRDAHLQYRCRRASLLRVPSQTAIGANHRRLLQVWEKRGREIWSDDHYNLTPIGGNQRRLPNSLQTASGPHLTCSRE